MVHHTLAILMSITKTTHLPLAQVSLHHPTPLTFLSKLLEELPQLLLSNILPRLQQVVQQTHLLGFYPQNVLTSNTNLCQKDHF